MTARELGEAVVKRLRALAVEERKVGTRASAIALHNAADELVQALEWEAQGDDVRALGVLS